MHAERVFVATLSILLRQKLSVMFTFEKLTNSNFCNGVCEKTFGPNRIAITKKIFFLMLPAFGILCSFRCVTPLYILEFYSSIFTILPTIPALSVGISDGV